MKREPHVSSLFYFQDLLRFSTKIDRPGPIPHRFAIKVALLLLLQARKQTGGPMIKRNSKIKQAQLQEFGLDPFEWILSSEADERVEFTNIDDPEMRLNVFLDATSSTTDIASMEWVL